MDNYVTFLAGIFRSVRFGASDAHGKANMVRFNFFQQQGALHPRRDDRPLSRRLRQDATPAMDALSAKLLTIQGDGDYAGVGQFKEQYGKITPETQKDLARLASLGVPVDIILDKAPMSEPTRRDFLTTAAASAAALAVTGSPLARSPSAERRAPRRAVAVGRDHHRPAAGRVETRCVHEPHARRGLPRAHRRAQRRACTP